MGRLNLIAAALFLGGTLSAPALAQLQPADRVRILTVHGITLTGTVTGMSGDSIALTAVPGRGQANWVRRPDIAYLERSAGRYRKFGRNLALTTLSGAAIGGMIGAITWTECVSNEFLGCLMHPESRSDAVVFGAVVTGSLSVPIGILLGLAIQYERWEPALDAKPGDWRSSFSVAPRLGRDFGVTASFSF